MQEEKSHSTQELSAAVGVPSTSEGCAAVTGTRSPDHYDAREGQAPEVRERQLMERLPGQIAHAMLSAPALGSLLQDVVPGEVTSRSALARLPVTRKDDLKQRQAQRRAQDVFGGFAAIGWAHRRGARRVFASPGPIYEPEGAGQDYWRTARALYAAGIRPGDLLHNSFSYHMTPAGSMFESGAHALGCTVFPAGVGNTEIQLQCLVDLQPAAYAGTPSFLRILLEKAAAGGIECRSLRRALVSGEPFPAGLRDWLADRGVAAYQCYATAELGLIAYETEAREGLVLAEDIVVEVVRCGTGDPVPDGEVGELVVTTLNPDYPLIRFGTGDLSAVLPGQCRTGRTNTRIKGWLGRADQATKVRGMFVHPSQVAEVVRRHPSVRRARLVISGEMSNDQMTLHVEADGQHGELATLLASSIRDVTKLRAEVNTVAPGTLPNDGKVIDDIRTFD